MHVSHRTIKQCLIHPVIFLPFSLTIGDHELHACASTPLCTWNEKRQKQKTVSRCRCQCRNVLSSTARNPCPCTCPLMAAGWRWEAVVMVAKWKWVVDTDDDGDSLHKRSPKSSANILFYSSSTCLLITCLLKHASACRSHVSVCPSCPSLLSMHVPMHHPPPHHSGYK